MFTIKKLVIIISFFLSYSTWAQMVAPAPAAPLVAPAPAVPVAAAPVAPAPAVGVAPTPVAAPVAPVNALNPPPESIIPRADVTPPASIVPMDVANGKSSDEPPPCPPASAYNVPAGYRLAGISPFPSCQGVVIPMDDPTPFEL